MAVYPQSPKDRLISILNSRLQDDTLSKKSYNAIEDFIVDLSDDFLYYKRYQLEILLENIEAVQPSLWGQNDRWDELFCALGADLNAINSSGKTPLMIAVNNGNQKLVERLIEWESTLNCEIKDEYGRTPLLIAAMENEWGIVKVLLDAGAKATVKDKSDYTPLMHAVVAFNKKRLDISGFTEILDSVDSNSMELKNNQGDTALMLAIKIKNWHAVKMLIEHGSQLNEKNNRIGYTAETLLGTIANKEDIKALENLGVKISDQAFQQEAFQQQLRLAKLIKKAGHILGFRRIISGINPMGMSSENAYNILKQCLDELPENSSFKNSTIEETVNVTMNFLRDNDTTSSYDLLINNYRAGKPTLLPIGWKNHDISVIIWNDVCILCNRGEDKLKNNISVFKINQEMMTGKFLQTIMPREEVLTSSEVLNSLERLVGDLENPILTFTSQDQKYGTCAFVNLKSSLKPFLCFINLLDAEGETVEHFNSEFLKKYLNSEGEPDKELLDIMMDSKNSYKTFTRTIDDQMVKKLCEAYVKLPIDSEERWVYDEMFSAILGEHHGQTRDFKGRQRSPEKIMSEQNRALEMLSVFAKDLTENEKARLLSELLPSSIVYDLKTFMWWIEQGADMHRMQESVLMRIIRDRQGELSQKDIEHYIQILHKRGIDLTEAVNGCTPIALAIMNQKWHVMDFLISLGVNPNMPSDENGATVLMLAVKYNATDYYVKKLTQDNDGLTGSLDIQDTNGNTALMYAIKAHNWNAVEALLNLGANVHIKNTADESALKLISELKFLPWEHYQKPYWEKIKTRLENAVVLEQTEQLSKLLGTHASVIPIEPKIESSAMTPYKNTTQPVSKEAVEQVKQPKPTKPLPL